MQMSKIFRNFACLNMRTGETTTKHKNKKHMKRLFTFAIAVAMCTAAMVAETVKINGLYYSLGTTTASVVSDQSSDKSTYSGYTTVTIPATVPYNGYDYTVTSIGTSAFENCFNLQSVTLPATITTINTDAFYSCTKLGSVNLPEGLTTIGVRALRYCNLTSVTIPSTVSSIGNYAFQNNPLTSVVWKPVTCSIGTDTYAPFYSTDSRITSFTFGDQVQLVPAYLCKGMSKLDTIVLPPSVYRLGEHAFQGCTSLKSINLPVTQQTLPVSFFEGCSALESIELPATLTTISTDAFYGCSKLAEVNLHEGITTIGTRAFRYCKLASVTIPSTVTSIGNYAFQNNPLTSVVWQPVTCTIGSDDSAPFYSTDSRITSFTFGDQVQLVPAYLCKGMNKLDTVVLPPSVNRLGEHAFQGCTSLKSINLPVTQQTLPVSFLEGCSALESIELPATLTTISTDAFYGCSKLAEVNLHEGITTIGTRAFRYCKLTSVTIPSTVSSIGNHAFQNNPLTSVVWQPVTCTIGSDDSAPFYSTDSRITSFTFGDSVKTIPNYLCYNMNKLENITLPDHLTTIGQCAFKNCSKIKNIVIPASVTSIGSSAFIYCTALNAFEFPEGIKTIATSVLEGCTALKSVKFPESVTTISQDALYNCSSLQALYNYAYTPQTIVARTIYNVNQHTCVLYIPKDAYPDYAAKAVWCDFDNKVKMNTGLRFEDVFVNFSYLDQDSVEMYGGVETVHMPIAPVVEGFTFLKWIVLAGDFADGIRLQAVYTADQPTGAPAFYTNPANPTQKLIRNGQVYILQDGKTYSITGIRTK